MNETIATSTNDEEILLLRKKLHLLLCTGKLLMENGADSNRIEENMLRMAAYMDIPEEKLHIDIRWTMLMVNVSDERHSFSKFQKCQKHVINMSTISEVSQLSWTAIENDYSLERLEVELDKISNKPRSYHKYLVAICAGLACGGFCKLFGCDWIAFIFASISAFLGFRARTYCYEKIGISLYISILISASVATFLAYLSTLTNLSTTPYQPLLACALYIIPGVPIINFVDDMIDNHLLGGITRAANALMIVGSMTFGIAFALKVLVIDDITITQKFNELSMIAHQSYFMYAIAAAIAAMGFSMIFNIPRNLLWLVGVGGIVSVCTRNYINLELGYGAVIGSFVGAFIISILAIEVSRIYKVPRHVFSIPSVIPLIPGVLMYRTLLAFITLDGVNGEITSAFANGISAVLTILCISLGVAIPNIFARKYIAKAKDKALSKKLKERKERGVFNEWYKSIY